MSDATAGASESAVPLFEYLGMRLRALRIRATKTQAEIAMRANAAGIPWVQQTVAAIEQGKRPLTLVEFLLLPSIYGVSRLAALADDEDNQPLELTQRVTIPAWTFRAILRGQRPEVRVGKSYVAGPDALARKLAARLDLDPALVNRAALHGFGTTMTAEREARVVQRVAEDASPAQLQAVRGHVTRQLQDEVQALVDRYRRDLIERGSPQKPDLPPPPAAIRGTAQFVARGLHIPSEAVDVAAQQVLGMSLGDYATMLYQRTRPIQGETINGYVGRIRELARKHLMSEINEALDLAARAEDVDPEVYREYLLYGLGESMKAASVGADENG